MLQLINIELNTCIDAKSYQHCMVYKCFMFAGYVLPRGWVYWTWCVYALTGRTFSREKQI